MTSDPIGPTPGPRRPCSAAVRERFLGGCLALLLGSSPASSSPLRHATTPAAPERGFRVRTLQLPAAPGSLGTVAPIPADLAWTESMLGGALGSLTINPLVFAEDGFYHESGTINYAAPLPVVPEIFQGELPGDSTYPGLPSFGSSSYENAAVEITTFLEFASPGTYRFTLRAGNLFKLSIGHSPAPPLVEVQSPHPIAGPIAAVPSVRDDPLALGIFGRLPTRPLEADLMPVVGTATNAADSQGCGSELANAPDVAGHIALVDRGGCSFVEKVRNAANAGAVAVLVANDLQDPPIVMGGVPNELPLPALMIRQVDGTRLRSNPGARLRLSAAPPDVVAADTRLSTPKSTSFDLRIGTPGWYPVRLVTQVLSSPATLEWTVSAKDTDTVLLNAPDQEAQAAVRAYQTAPALPEPAINIHRQGTQPVLGYVGVLQSAPAPDGPFHDEPLAPISGTIPIERLTGGGFFRTRW
jgi:hypothetical protein